MGTEFGRSFGLSVRGEEVEAEVVYGVALSAAGSSFWRGPQDPPRVRLDGGGWLRERDAIVSGYPGRVTVVNGLERSVDGSFRFEGVDGGWLERERLRWDRDHVLGDDFESHLPGPAVVLYPSDG